MSTDAPTGALYDPAEHRPLGDLRWSEAAALAAVAEIAADAVHALRDPRMLWPNHPADMEDDEDLRVYRSVYLGGAGMMWGLHRIAAAGLGPELPDLAEIAATLPAAYLADPELAELETGTPPPPPSLLFGESGILIACEAVAGPDPDRHAALARTISANAHNPTRELCWGSPGTLYAAEAMWRATGEERWRELWRESAAWLIEEWEEPVWTQDMYGERRRYVGAGHGFAGNAGALLAGLDLLEDSVARAATAFVERTIETVVALADRDEAHELAQWPALADEVTERRPVQWCHGAPGIITSLAGLPSDPRIDALLAAGGELTWRAGPLRKGVGLCHGTAGNGYALLALHHRTGEERWLERARVFALDAAAEASAWRKRHGRGRYTLFTGDLGVALLLADCLEGNLSATPGLPFLHRPLR